MRYFLTMMMSLMMRPDDDELDDDDDDDAGTKGHLLHAWRNAIPDNKNRQNASYRQPEIMSTRLILSILPLTDAQTF